MPEVSVVIPAFNAAGYLPAAIRSVLDQGFSDLEIVVVDDGSTDGTGRLMEAEGGPVRYLRQPNRGVAGGPETGAAASRGRDLPAPRAGHDRRPREDAERHAPPGGHHRASSAPRLPRA